mmetsp:Transcript_2341/g.6739  ORF Transcript_2341/g.6739 Transcript_2341/m.6739 type:complete len:288 (+) Transcript_2341:68-931(+)
MNESRSLRLLFGILILGTFVVTEVRAFSGPIKSRPFTRDGQHEKPKLIMIGGCSGTGKSTFGMSVALDQGILKCISTDTLRSVMRSFVTKEISPALHRSSFEPSTEDGSDDPVKSWKQTCTVLNHCVHELVDEMILRGASIVIEGVHLIPDNTLLERWEASGGVATGIILQVSDEEAHKGLLLRRGVMTGKGESQKLEKFNRIRAIHDEMVRLAKEKNWVLIEQNLQPDPLEIVASQLWQGETVDYLSVEQLTSRTQRRSEDFWAVTANGNSTSDDGKHHISANDSK